MAQESFRFLPAFLGGSYWRVDLSWRTSTADQHFAEEWSAGIPVQTGESTWFDISSMRIQVKNTNELLSVDRVSFQFDAHAKIVSALDPDNESVDVRLWWSADAVTWVPMFWGIVDLDEIDPDTEAVVAGTYRKTYSFTAYDSIDRLKRIPFRGVGVFTGTSVSILPTSYMIGVANNDVYLCDADLSATYAWLGTPPVATSVLPSGGSTQLVSSLFFLEETALLCFEEHYFQSAQAPLAYYGLHPTTATTSPFTFGAATDTGSPPTIVWNTFDKLYYFHDAYSTEWLGDYKSWADLVAEHALQFGFGVRTRHEIVSGKWIRRFNYLRLDGENNLTLGYDGALLRHSGGLFRRVGRTVCVTTRFFEGGHKINDFVYGTGETRNVGLHYRTMGDLGAGSVIGTYGCNQARNILWGAACMRHPTISDRIQVVNFVKYLTITRPTTSYNAWYADSLLNGNGWAQALGMHLADITFPPRKRTIEDQLSEIRAADPARATNTPANWAPGAKIADDEYNTETFRVLSVDINPGEGTVSITKEQL